MIDVKQMLAASFTEPNATKRELIPPKDYLALIKDVDLEVFPGKKDPTKSFLKLNLQYSIDDPALRTALGRDEVVKFDNFLLDMTDAGTLDFGRGKNVRLGRLREACGQNVPGNPWSFPMLKGQVVRIKIGQELYNGEPIDTVDAVTKAI
jgi:hypothetical protein